MFTICNTFSKLFYALANYTIFHIDNLILIVSYFNIKINTINA